MLVPLTAISPGVLETLLFSWEKRGNLGLSQSPGLVRARGIENVVSLLGADAHGMTFNPWGEGGLH